MVTDPAVRRRSGWPVLVGAVGAVALVGGLLVIRTRSSEAGACGAEVRERLDPRSLQHVLPGAPAPSYSSAAPTSGPHQAGFVEAGVRDEPIPPALQVGALEDRAVLVQHRPDLGATELASLRALAGRLSDQHRVIVAPNPGLEAPIVATAWQVRLVCSRADPKRLSQFIRARPA